MPNIKAVLFDFDDTLVNSLPLVFESFRQVFKKFGKGYMSDDEITLLLGPPEIHIIKENILNKEQADFAIDTYYQTYYDNHSRFISVTEEIKGLMNFLKASDVKLGIITAKGNKSLDMSLDLLEIRDLFDVIIAGNDVKLHKPHPEGILKALNILNCESINTTFVGDSDSDIEAGKSANTFTVRADWFRGQKEKACNAKPDVIFNNVIDFQDYFKSRLLK